MPFKSLAKYHETTVDSPNSAPVEGMVVEIPLFTGFGIHPRWFFPGFLNHQQYHKFQWFHRNFWWKLARFELLDCFVIHPKNDATLKKWFQGLAAPNDGGKQNYFVVK